VLVLLTLLTAGYFAVVIRVRRAGKLRRAAQAQPVELPEDDRPPETAVGWPPVGAEFSAYVDEGFAALDAYLSEGFAA
jgi:hypothetical protein